MSKWINVDAFVADARMVGLDTAEKVFFALAHQPGIDIVRCGECKYRKHRVDFQNDYCIKHSKVLYDTGGGCSWGKRSSK